MRGLTEDQKNAAILLSDTMSWRKIAKHLKVPKSTVSDFLRKVKNEPTEDSNRGAKILFLDVENQGTVAMTHSRFKAFISPKSVISEPYLLSYAGNWAHESEDDVFCSGLQDMPTWADGDYRNDILLVEELWELLDQCDILICHNTGFDEGVINSRFAYYGMSPPSPYKVVCTLKSLKKYFKLPANSLDAATRYFNLERKLDNSGIDLWLRCYYGDVEAFETMCEYNRGDIPTLRQLYYKILPFIKNHPNLALYSNEKGLCGQCGKGKMELVEGKKAYTNVSKFSTYRCDNCGAVKRSRKNERSKDEMSNTLMNIY
jgi:hypothetical protein